MKEISVIEPVFFQQFTCVGSDCPDHCCKEWSISLDKPTVNRYLKSSQIDIRTIAAEHIITTKNNYANWGKIKLTHEGHCAFMDEDRLCKVHKSLGESALSQTCATYPRVLRNFKHEIRKNLTLSCPEAAKKLLLTPDAMLFSEKKQLQAKAQDEADMHPEARLLNLMCTNIMISSGVNNEQGFYGIVLLFLYLDKLEKGPERYEKLEAYYSSIIASLQSGNISNSLAELKPDYQLQSALLLRLQGFLSTKERTRGWATLQHYTNKLIYLQSTGLESEGTERTMQRLSLAWQEKVLPWLAARPHIISNYLQYRLYEDIFPNKGGRNKFANLYLLVSEWFLLKSLLAACADLVGEMQEEDVINIIYSYHSVTKHDKSAEVAFLEQIEFTKVNDDLSLIYLLT